DAPGIGSCGLKQAKHRPFSGHFDAEKRFIEKTVERVRWPLAAIPTACDSSFRCERAAESSAMSQHALLVFREQAIAPIESRRQGAVPRQRCPSTSREDREAIVETGRHFAKPELCYSSSSKLERKRYSVEPPAYFGDHRKIPLLRFETHGRLNTVDKESDS